MKKRKKEERKIRLMFCLSVYLSVGVGFVFGRFGFPDQNCVFKCVKSEENETIECRIEAEKGTFWRSAGRTGEGGDRMLDQIACLNA